MKIFLNGEVAELEDFVEDEVKDEIQLNLEEENQKNKGIL